MPFIYLGEFVRLAVEPAAITLAAQVAGRMLAARTAPWAYNFFWWAVFSLVVIPFAVSWTCLAVRGREATKDRSWFTMGRRELKYLLTGLAMSLVLGGPVTVCFYGAYLHAWSLPLTLLAFAVLAIALGVAMRFAFVLPAIALDDFRGFKEAWHQTRSTVLRILGVVLLSLLPINLLQSILRHQQKNPPGDYLSLFVLAVADVTVIFLSSVVSIGAVARCYRFKAGIGSVAELILEDAGLTPDNQPD